MKGAKTTYRAGQKIFIPITRTLREGTVRTLYSAT